MWGDRAGGVWQPITTAPLPNPPFSTMSAQTSPTGRGVGEGEKDKEQLNTTKLQLRKHFSTQDIKKTFTYSDM